jgi:hypothetical protein
VSRTTRACGPERTAQSDHVPCRIGRLWAVGEGVAASSQPARGGGDEDQMSTSSASHDMVRTRGCQSGGLNARQAQQIQGASRGLSVIAVDYDLLSAGLSHNPACRVRDLLGGGAGPQGRRSAIWLWRGGKQSVRQTCPELTSTSLGRSTRCVSRAMRPPASPRRLQLPLGAGPYSAPGSSVPSCHVLRATDA